MDTDKPSTSTEQTSAEIRAEIVQAGIDAGFYDREDSEYVNIVRNGPPSSTKATEPKD